LLSRRLYLSESTAAGIWQRLEWGMNSSAVAEAKRPLSISNPTLQRRSAMNPLSE
jgi:hypothetical protein